MEGFIEASVVCRVGGIRARDGDMDNWSRDEDGLCNAQGEEGLAYTVCSHSH